MLFLELAAASALIIVAGTFLTRYGDRIAEKTGLGHAWVGLVLLAFATSLPELVTSVGAVTIPKAPNLVFGNVLGSNAFNLVILVVLDILCGRESVLVQVGRRASLSAALGVAMMLLLVMPLVLVHAGGPLGAQVLPWMWITSPVIFAAYLCSMRLISRDEHEAMKEVVKEALAPPGERGPARRELIAFGICALVILGAGLWLSNSADRLAAYEFHVAGRPLVLGQTFVGALLLAIVTSLPELVVTISAFRLGAHAMALGNLLGSNIFNVAIVSIADLANVITRGRSMFSGDPPLSPVHAVTGLVAILMGAIVIVGLSGRQRRRRFPAGWETSLMVLIYLGGLYLIFLGSATR